MDDTGYIQFVTTSLDTYERLKEAEESGEIHKPAGLDDDAKERLSRQFPYLAEMFGW